MMAVLTEDGNAEIMMSDEAYFYWNGNVNKISYHYLAAENKNYTEYLYTGQCGALFLQAKLLLFTFSKTW